jgi:hypothetical protein
MGLREMLGFRAKEHWVEIHDVRRLPTDADQFDACFAAICSCGWVEAPLSSEADARASGSRHSQTVYPDLKRPVG